MPIARALQRAQLWNTPGYVCSSCQHKLLLGRRPLTRSQTNLSPTEGGGDDWAHNFNDFSSDLPGPSKKRSNDESSNARKEDGSSTKDTNQDGRHERTTKGVGRRKGRRDAMLELPASFQKEHKNWKPPKSNPSPTLAHLKMDLTKLLDPRTGTEQHDHKAAGYSPHTELEPEDTRAADDGLAGTEAENIDAAEATADPSISQVAPSAFQKRRIASQLRTRRVRSRMYHLRMAQKFADDGPEQDLESASHHLYKARYLDAVVAKDNELVNSKSGAVRASQNLSTSLDAQGELTDIQARKLERESNVEADKEAIAASEPLKSTTAFRKSTRHKSPSYWPRLQLRERKKALELHLSMAEKFSSDSPEPDSERAKWHLERAQKIADLIKKADMAKVATSEGLPTGQNALEEVTVAQPAHLETKSTVTSAGNDKVDSGEALKNGTSPNSTDTDSRSQLERVLQGQLGKILQSKFQDMIDSLRSDTKQDDSASTSKGEIEPQNQSNAIAQRQQPGMPSFKSTPPPTASNQGSLSAIDMSLLAEREKAMTPPKPPRPLQVPAFAARATTTPTTPIGLASRSEKPLSLAQKVEESRDRPKWGGITPPARERSARLAVSELLDAPAESEINNVDSSRNGEERNGSLDSPTGHEEADGDVETAVASRTEDDSDSTKTVSRAGGKPKSSKEIKRRLSAEVRRTPKRRVVKGMNDESLDMLPDSTKNAARTDEHNEDSSGEVEEESFIASVEKTGSQKNSTEADSQAVSSSLVGSPKFPRLATSALREDPAENAREESFAAVSNAPSGGSADEATAPREKSSGDVVQNEHLATSEQSTMENDFNAVDANNSSAISDALFRKVKSSSGPLTIGLHNDLLVRKHALLSPDWAEGKHLAKSAASDVAPSQSSSLGSTGVSKEFIHSADSGERTAERDTTEFDAAFKMLQSLHPRHSAVHDGSILLQKSNEDEPAETQSSQAYSELNIRQFSLQARRLHEQLVKLLKKEERETVRKRNVAPVVEPATTQSFQSDSKLNIRKFSRRARGLLEQLAKVLKDEEREGIMRGTMGKNTNLRSNLLRLLRHEMVSTNPSHSALHISKASAEGVANVRNDAPSEDGSGTSGRGGGDDNDDGEHKSLWEVMSKADAFADKATDAAANEVSESEPPEPPPLDLSSSEPADVLTIKPSDLVVEPLNIPQAPVPGLEYGLDRVLFNPGVYQLQDPHSRVYNFDPYLQKIMPVIEFDFNALKQYKTSSQDSTLSSLANEYGKRYIGSTSSMTSMLGHFHYLLSDWRPLNLNMLSRGFTDKLDTFTLLNRAPNAIFLRYKNGTYAVDADKQYDSGNVLMLLGKSMEKLLTMPTSEYERYRKSDPRTVSEEERNAPESFEYTTMGDFLMRSQLDAYDPRLPGTGMFDLKTRAVISVRMDAEDFQPMTGYEIHTLQGRFGSYEREFYDMMRSTMLKYMLQARMGRMDGIFIAYHNVERIFGFQYLPIQEMDRAIHGQVDRCLGDQEFRTSLELVNRVFDKATAKFPEQSLRFHFETATESLGTGTPTTVMWIFAEPMEESEIDRIQATSKAKVAEFERTMMGVDKDEISPAASTEAVASSDGHGNAAQPAETNVSMEGEAQSSVSVKLASDYVTSNSGADPEFLETIASSDSVEHKPLFAASLICKSRVNGMSVQRPEILKPEDRWEVEYLLREWNAPDAMWARYEQMKTKRQQMFEKLQSEEEMAEENGSGELTSKQKRERAFIEFLRSMSRSGREFRSRIDQLEAGKEAVVVGHKPVRIVEEKIENVDEYTAWLYGSDRT